MRYKVFPGKGRSIFVFLSILPDSERRISQKTQRLFHRLAFVTGIALSTALALPAQQIPSSVAATVNFSTSVSVRSASGLLIGDDPSVPKASVTSLQPALWRFTGTPELYLPYAATGTQLQFVLSDAYCYAASNWCGKPPPYENWTGYQALVRSQAQNMIGQNVMFDVWNEPDYANSWSGTQEQFFQTYLHAYQTLRQVLGPAAVIGGPSLAGGYNKAYIEAFLNFCVQNGCEVNFLSWHELLDTDSDIMAISTHLADARTSFLNNPQYSSLKMGHIYVNEMVGPVNTHKPGAILGYLYQIEKGGGDGAAKTCWPDSAGQNECFNGTLDGLLTSSTRQPRSAWWAVKTYADGVTSRVASSSGNQRITVLGSSQSASPSTAQVLVGYYNYGASVSINVNLSLTGLKSLGFLGAAPTIHVLTEQIPDSGENALLQPISLNAEDLPILNGTLTLTLPNLTPGQLYRISLSASAATTQTKVRQITNRNSTSDSIGPGSVISIAGSISAHPAAEAESASLPRTIAGIRVLLNGDPMPILRADSTHIEAQVPFETPPGPSSVTIEGAGGTSAPEILNISQWAPSLVRRPGGENASARYEDGGDNAAGLPARSGTLVGIMVTGMGRINPDLKTGELTAPTISEDYSAYASISVGGIPAELISLRFVSDSYGAAEAKIRIPILPRGTYPVTFRFNGVLSSAASIQIE